MLTGGNDDSTEIAKPAAATPSIWSRGLIIGLCAGLTVVILLIAGLLILCRYVLRQRKLKINFENELEMGDSRYWNPRSVTLCLSFMGDTQNIFVVVVVIEVKCVVIEVKCNGVC